MATNEIEVNRNMEINRNACNELMQFCKKILPEKLLRFLFIQLIDVDLIGDKNNVAWYHPSTLITKKITGKEIASL